MKLDTVAFVLGLVALIVGLFPKQVEGHNYVFWFGVTSAALGAVFFVLRYVSRVHIQLLSRRAQLENILNIAIKETGRSRDELIARVSGLAKSGAITLYGEHGSSRSLDPIPARHFNSHELFDDPLTGTLRTYDPQRSLGDQDTANATSLCTLL